ncbi:MAG: thioredoxin domain-containing protein [Candidatus Abyssobacteria bacterium SURF_5]|uniref:Thioredoxin domain-containing protein n=1 Tax=Abyssobacteria bacterium (strain SURF_5) TaxID=2093360 RepID=A0A3A4NY66_ABYX5|nr:MAG: thioredoxin domain-containing protein [Candidatus Abyssubacteria bacterium SURF_5]
MSSATKGVSIVDKIQWLEWSPEAFEKARREDKLILLDIGAPWCHWCHVMDEEAYGNHDIRKLVEQLYVPVRVECDKRPDINERYNQGGWPTTVIMSHEGFVVHGATYLPSPALKELLKQAKNWYDQNRKRISEAAGVLATEAARVSPLAAPEPHQVKELTSEIIEDILKNSDPVHGGFGDSAKFPQAGPISLAFAQFFRTADERLLAFAEKTLQNMSAGLLDKEAGGLFRYSVSPEWNEPHYEKNLIVNAESLQNYLDAYRLTGKKEYAVTAENIIRFITEKLLNPDGGFSNSQDADIFDEHSLRIIMEGETYYSLPLSERQKYGEPVIDRTVYVNASARAISAILEAYHLLQNENLREIALKSLDYLMKNAFDKDSGALHYPSDGRKGTPAFLDDAVSLARANLDAYETTADHGYLESAKKLMEVARARFAAPDGGFYDATLDSDMPPATQIRHKPLHENMAAVETFGRLYNYTADSAYLMIAASTLISFEQNVRNLLEKDLGYMAAEYALAFQFASDRSTKVTIVGSAKEAKARKLLHEAKRLYRPAKIVQLLDPSKDIQLIKAMRYPVEDIPAAHVCTEKGCAPPIRDIDELAKLMIS